MNIHKVPTEGGKALYEILFPNNKIGVKPKGTQENELFSTSTKELTSFTDIPEDVLREQIFSFDGTPEGFMLLCSTSKALEKYMKQPEIIRKVTWKITIDPAVSLPPQWLLDYAEEITVIVNNKNVYFLGSKKGDMSKLLKLRKYDAYASFSKFKKLKSMKLILNTVDVPFTASTPEKFYPLDIEELIIEGEHADEFRTIDFRNFPKLKKLSLLSLSSIWRFVSSEQISLEFLLVNAFGNRRKINNALFKHVDHFVYASKLRKINSYFFIFDNIGKIEPEYLESFGSVIKSGEDRITFPCRIFEAIGTFQVWSVDAEYIILNGNSHLMAEGNSAFNMKRLKVMEGVWFSEQRFLERGTFDFDKTFPNLIEFEGKPESIKYAKDLMKLGHTKRKEKIKFIEIK